MLDTDASPAPSLLLAALSPEDWSSSLSSSVQFSTARYSRISGASAKVESGFRGAWNPVGEIVGTPPLGIRNHSSDVPDQSPGFPPQ